MTQKLKFVLGKLENSVGEKGENTGYLFPTMFSNDFFSRDVNSFPNKPWFLRVCSTSLLKTVLHLKKKKEKRAISPFPTLFSTHFKNFLPFSSNFELSSANSFSLEV